MLLKELATQFDGKIYGINLPETAVDFDENNPPEDFTFNNYFFSELENNGKLREAFNKSIVMQYLTACQIFN